MYFLLDAKAVQRKEDHKDVRNEYQKIGHGCTPSVGLSDGLSFKCCSKALPKVEDLQWYQYYCRAGRYAKRNPVCAFVAALLEASIDPHFVADGARFLTVRMVKAKLPRNYWSSDAWFRAADDQ